MKASLPIFAGLLMAAGIVALLGLPTLPEGPPKADAAQQLAPNAEPEDKGPDETEVAEDKAAMLVRSALAAIEQRDAITARVRVKIDAFGEQMEGAGVYRQGRWADQQIRLSVQFDLPAATAELVQVCDGAQLWIKRSLPHEETLQRADIRPVLEALDRGAQPKATADAVRTLGLAGLPRLLRGLDDAFAFNSAQQRMLGDMPIWLIEGTWRAERMGELLPGQNEALAAGRPPDWTALPPQAPDRVRLVLGREDLFPYRIEWLRTRASISQKWHHFGRDQSHTLLKLDLLDVQLDGPVDPAEFAFDPGGQAAVDVTAEYLKSLAP